MKIRSVFAGAFGLLLFGLFCFAAYVLVGLLIIAYPTNERDNQDPAAQKQMMELTLEWGRLAPFPADAENVTIETEGNMFTRSFRSSFTAPEEAIKKWIEDSPGMRDAQIKTLSKNRTKYTISPGDGASFAEVIVDFSRGRVDIYVAWS